MNAVSVRGRARSAAWKRCHRSADLLASAASMRRSRRICGIAIRTPMPPKRRVAVSLLAVRITIALLLPPAAVRGLARCRMADGGSPPL